MDEHSIVQAAPEPMDVDRPQTFASTHNTYPTIAKAPASLPLLEHTQNETPPTQLPYPSAALGDSAHIPDVLPAAEPPAQIKDLADTNIETVFPHGSNIDFGRSSVFRVDQSTSAWQTAQDALEAGMGGLSNISNPQRTGGRRGRGPRRHVSPVPSGTITLKPYGTVPTTTSAAPVVAAPAPEPAAAATTTTATTTATTANSANTPTTPRRASNTPRRGRGGRARGRKSVSGSKRKRSTDSDDENDHGSSSSEEITALPSQSRSGRKITQAHQVPSVKLELEDEDTREGSPIPAPKHKASSNNHASAASPATTKPTPQKPAAKKVKRTPGQSAVCKNCSRGPSPASNAIVFCDGCNTPWHQHCHDPPIKQEYLLEVDRDWFCADCVLLREHSETLEGKVAGHGMSMLEKRKYLKSLPPSTLVALLLHATSLYPNLPIFPPKPPVVNIDLATLDADDQGLYEEIVDELPYPKAGHGIQLRPEAEDASILVDDNIAVYSHRWKGIAEMMLQGGWARKGSGVRTVNGLGIKAGA